MFKNKSFKFRSSLLFTQITQGEGFTSAFFVNLFLWQLAEKYGNVYSLKMGSSWIVVLNGLNALQEGLLTKGDILVDRPLFPIHTDVLPDLGKEMFLTF